MKTTQPIVYNHVRPDNVFGLVGVRGHIVNLDGKTLDDLGTFKVAVGDLTASFTPAQALVTQNERLITLGFHLNSHLIEDGVHKVSMYIEVPGQDGLHFPEFEITVANHGALAEKCQDVLKGNDVPPIFGAVVDSSIFPYEDPLSQDMAIKMPLTGKVPMSVEPAADFAEAHAHLAEYGFCILPNKLPADLIEAFASELKSAMSTGELAHKPGSDRITLAHKKLPSARKIWMFDDVLKFLSEHFQDDPIACQTLTFLNGSQQDGHQDTIHLTAFPAGMMCGVWIALEDVQENSGELFVYPGSHRARRLMTKDLDIKKVTNDYSEFHKFSKAINNIIDEGGYERLLYRPKAGQILVWSENLIHGGSPRDNDSKSRLSVVSHYFARGGIGYYDSRGTAASVDDFIEERLGQKV